MNILYELLLDRQLRHIQKQLVLHKRLRKLLCNHQKLIHQSLSLLILRWIACVIRKSI